MTDTKVVLGETAWTAYWENLPPGCPPQIPPLDIQAAKVRLQFEMIEAAVKAPLEQEIRALKGALKLPEQDQGVGLSPGMLQAYRDAYHAAYEPTRHLDAHVAGLKAVVALSSPMTQDKHTGLRAAEASSELLETLRRGLRLPGATKIDLPLCRSEAVYLCTLIKADLAAPAPDKAGDREGVAQMRRALLIDDAFQRLGYTQKAVAWLAEMGVEVPCVPPYGNDLATFQKAERLTALSTGNEEPRREGVNPAVPKMAQRHAVDLEQCALFVESAPLKRAMADAASFLRELASPTPPVSPEPDSRAGVEREGRYRKKPVEITAEQWFPNGGVTKGVRWEKRSGDDGEFLHPYVITAHEQRVYLAPGDWIIPEAKPDRFYPCKPDVFAATYEPAALQSAPIASAAAGPVGALADIAAERRRQVEAEGWTPEHDDGHDKGEIARAAATYAMAGAMQTSHLRDNFLGEWVHGKFSTVRSQWPSGWDWSWFKPTTPRRDLVKAGALIVAEIERLDRATPTPAPHPVPAMEGR